MERDPPHATDIAKRQQTFRETGNLGHRWGTADQEFQRKESKKWKTISRESYTKYSKCFSCFTYLPFNRTSNFKKVPPTFPTEEAKFACYVQFGSAKSIGAMLITVKTIVVAI